MSKIYFQIRNECVFSHSWWLNRLKFSTCSLPPCAVTQWYNSINVEQKKKNPVATAAEVKRVSVGEGFLEASRISCLVLTLLIVSLAHNHLIRHLQGSWVNIERVTRLMIDLLEIYRGGETLHCAALISRMQARWCDETSSIWNGFCPDCSIWKNMAIKEEHGRAVSLWKSQCGVCFCGKRPHQRSCKVKF